MRANIKDALSKMLFGNQDKMVIKAAATCVAAIAAVEIPLGAWPELIPILTEQANNGETVEARLASL